MSTRAIDEAPAVREAAGDQPPESVGPFRALRNFYVRYARFAGRASRSELWWIVLWSLLAAAAGGVVLWAFGDGALDRVREQDPETLNSFGRGFAGAWGVLGLLHLIPWLTLCVRRLHDVNRSGPWLLTWLIPVVGVVFLVTCAVMPSDPKGMRFDAEIARLRRRNEERERAGFG